jgi:hypothetical protein
MGTSPSRPSAKLFHVLVAGGLALAGTACSSGDPVKNEGDAGGGAQDGSAASGDASSSHDAAVDADLDAAAAADACLNTPGDCTHGLCAW